MFYAEVRVKGRTLKYFNRGKIAISTMLRTVVPQHRNEFTRKPVTDLRVRGLRRKQRDNEDSD